MDKFEKKIEKVRTILKKFVDKGGDINSLTKKDSQYIAVCNLELFDKEGKKLSLSEKFSFLGFERNPKRGPFFEKAKKMLDEYVERGGSIDDLSPGHAVYDYISFNTVKKADGSNMTIVEKFEKLGYFRTPKKGRAFVKARKMLDEFVANGGSVDDMKTTHPIYQYICFSDMSKDGVFLKTLEERFEALGHPRKRKISKDVRETLIEEIDKYIANGGQFDVDHTQLPFSERMRTYIRRFQKEGNYITFEEAMKDLGYKNFSDTYTRCKKLESLKNFRDQEGYVDSYRSDKVFAGYITSLSKSLGLPYSIIIQLLCDEKLKTISISTEYISHVKAEFVKFIEENGSLKGVSRNKALYEKLHNLRRYISSGAGESFTNEEILAIMELDVDHNLKNISEKQVDVDSIMSKCKDKKVVKYTDFDGAEYRALLSQSIKLGIPMTELFKSYGIEYHGKNRDRLSARVVDKMPYLKEMKARRDKLLAKSTVNKENGCCKEEIFEEKVRICKQVYGEFKDKIYNFVPDNEKEKD